MPSRKTAETRKSWFTLEFWAAILPIVVKGFWPEMPEQSIAVLWGWAANRSAQKLFGFVGDNGKRSYCTLEFWISVGYSLVVSVFPDVPVEALNQTLVGVLGWVTSRTGIKIRMDRINLKTGKK